MRFLAIVVCGDRVLLRFRMAAVLVMMRRLAMMVSRLFMPCGRVMVMLAGLMLGRSHIFLLGCFCLGACTPCQRQFGSPGAEL
jgi:hypothetical protein